jgi:hypothetical protein
MLMDSKKSWWKGLLKHLFRILVPIAFFFYAFHVINPKDVISSFRKAGFIWFFAGAGCILILNHLCALRTRALLVEKKHSLPRLYAIHTLSSMVAGMLPFRTGELSFAYYLRKYLNVPANEGMAILISVRVVEYFIFLIFLTFLSAFGIFIEPSGLSLGIFSLIAINLILVMLVVWNANIFFRPLKFIIHIVLGFVFSKPYTDSIFAKIELFSHDIRRAFSGNFSTSLLIITFWIVFLRQVFVLVMLRSMGVHIGLWLVILLFAFLYAAKFIQGFGSFGTQEAGISAALVLTGQTQLEALPIAIGAHLLQWAPILLFGCISYLALKFDSIRRFL